MYTILSLGRREKKTEGCRSKVSGDLNPFPTPIHSTPSLPLPPALLQLPIQKQCSGQRPFKTSSFASFSLEIWHKRTKLTTKDHVKFFSKSIYPTVNEPFPSPFEFLCPWKYFKLKKSSGHIYPSFLMLTGKCSIALRLPAVRESPHATSLFSNYTSRDTSIPHFCPQLFNIRGLHFYSHSILSAYPLSFLRVTSNAISAALTSNGRTDGNHSKSQHPSGNTGSHI